MVFWYSAFKEGFKVLYFFDVAQGDTIILDCPDFANTIDQFTEAYRFKVDSVVEKTIDGENLHSIHTSYLDDFGFGNIIDEIGGWDCLFPRPKTGLPVSARPIRCYSSNDIKVNFLGKHAMQLCLFCFRSCS